MINVDTVFIIGAGAGSPYGFPTGLGLREYVCSNFVKKYEKLLKPKFGNPSDRKSPLESAREFVDIFYKSSDASIDTFLAKNPSFSEIGKRAIVWAMLEYERNSRFHEDSPVKDQDWYSFIFRKMRENLDEPQGYKDFGKNKITFVTFNYDRSLESFLHESLVHSYYDDDDKDNIISELSKIRIYHVYGKVAVLDWQKADTQMALPYKSDFGINELESLAANIRSISEQRDSCEDLEKIRNSISRASRIYFLGFGYGEENIKLLKLFECLNENHKIFGTAKGLLPHEIRRQKSYFHDRIFLRNGVVMEDADSLTLLREYLY